MTGFTCQTIRLFLSSISCGYKNIQPFMVALLISFPVRPTTKFNKKKKKKLTQKAQSFSIYKILNSDQYLTNEWTKQNRECVMYLFGKRKVIFSIKYIGSGQKPLKKKHYFMSFTPVCLCTCEPFSYQTDPKQTFFKVSISVFDQFLF